MHRCGHPKQVFFGSILALIFVSFRIPDLIPGPAPRPFITQPETHRNEQKIHELEEIDPRNAEVERRC